MKRKVTQEYLDAMIADAVRVERERCAKLVEGYTTLVQEKPPIPVTSAFLQAEFSDLARAIRKAP